MSYTHFRPSLGITQQGFIALPIWGYAAIGASVVIAGLGIALKVQTARLDAVKAEYASFVAQTKAIGEAAEKEAKRKEAEDKKRKESADADLTRARSELAGVVAAYRGLRDSRARSGFLPAPAASSASASRACFDRTELERTLGAIDAGGGRIAEEGDAARIGLDAARAWAR